MRKSLLSFFALMLLPVAVLAQKPAFPGAEGYGRFTQGGRGGKIVHVTNLKDSGSGSFREAVKGNDPKIVVFDVGGIIALNSDLQIGANTTILGQTAPGEGITLRYYTLAPNANNIVMRFIRSRRGEEKNVNDGADACWTSNMRGMIIDHCSFSWSIDEVASFYDNRDFTMQWCTVAEPLHNPGHTKGQHGYGGIWGGKGASFHHNFLAHMDNRSPRFDGARYVWEGYDKARYENTVIAELVDFRNCVVYNWGGGGCYGGPGGGFVNMVNNYYKSGPATTHKNRVTTCSVANQTTATNGDKRIMGLYSRYYISGNYVYGRPYGANYDWKGVVYDDNKTSFVDKYNMYLQGEGATIEIKLDEEVEMAEVTTHDAETAFEKVRLLAGASLVRDICDNRYAEEALNGTATYTGSKTNKKGLLDVVADQGEYTLASSSRPADFDSDHDGIPDAWEIANGLNPNDASDAAVFSLDPAKYYTNIEVYANSLVQELIIEGNADALFAVSEYFPAYVKEDGTAVEAINLPEISSGGETGGEELPEGVEGTITWGLHNGTQDKEAEVSADIAQFVVSTDFSLGSDFSISGKRTLNNIIFSSVGCSTKNNSTNAQSLLDFSFTMADGYKFLPTELGLKASRNGTDSGVFDIVWLNDEGKSYVESNYAYNRNNGNPPFSAYSTTSLSGIVPCDGEQHFQAYFYSINKDKGFFLADVYIKGIVVGATGIEDVDVDTELPSSDSRRNLFGQPVGKDFKGIVIQRGRKILLR